MATTKDTITNREALHLAVDTLKVLECENTQLIEKLQKMAKAADTRAENAAKSPRTKSKETIENEKRAQEVAKVMKAHGEPVTSDWLTDNIPGLTTTGKASGCMKTAIKLGLVEKVGFEKVNGKPRVTYKAI